MQGILNKAKVFTDSEFERRGGTLTHTGHCRTMIALLCEGRSDFVDTGVLNETRPPKLKSPKTIFLHFEVTERISDPDGQLLLTPEYSINSWWSNIPYHTSTVIEFYHTPGNERAVPQRI